MSYLFAGYAVLWTILFIFVIYLIREQKNINDELSSLSEKLRTGSGAGSL